MRLPVVVTDRASQDIETSFDYIFERSPQAAEKWRQGIARFITGLAILPASHPLAEKTDDLNLQIRTALFGKRQLKYRVYYYVSAGAIVVMHVRHGARKAPIREDFIE